jgi:putative transposase
MAWKRFTKEEIIGLLRETEVRLSQGQAIGTVCRWGGASE